jgi:hypothetical protein
MREGWYSAYFDEPHWKLGRLTSPNFYTFTIHVVDLYQLKFTSDGYVHVGLREIAYNADDRIVTVELSVNDTGKACSSRSNARNEYSLVLTGD